MADQAISLRRISSPKQNDGNSLPAQKTSTEEMAKEMDLILIKTWDEIRSSKRGKNFKRPDMEEMYRFCKQNRKVKYLLIDFVNRLMREAEMMIYYKVRFNQLGVNIVFCDPGQRHLNGDDQYSRLLFMIEAHKAEQDNDSRTETTIARMKARYAAGYYPSRPHAGYMKSSIAGLHIPNPDTFELIKKSTQLIIYEHHTATQAVAWLNANGYKTPEGNKMDLDHYISQLQDPYYHGIIYVKSEGWPKNVRGLHEPMYSLREHELLIAAFTKRNPRVRRKTNPDFPMSNLLRHAECMGMGKYEKFVGHWYNRGKRSNGKQRPLKPVYDCRDCRQRIGREVAHSAISERLHEITLSPSEERFKEALVKVWRAQRGSVTQRLNVIQARINDLEQKTKDTANALVSEPYESAKQALRMLLDQYDKDIKALGIELRNTREIELESEAFVKFALQFAENLKTNWWDISVEDRKRGEQILFNGKLYIDNTAKVHTPQLSTIYRLAMNKKDLSNSEKSLLVELPGTAPGSASLHDSHLQV